IRLASPRDRVPEHVSLGDRRALAGRARHRAHVPDPQRQSADHDRDLRRRRRSDGVAAPLGGRPMGKKDPRGEAYIAKADQFARPILEHLRAIVHKGCPAAEEAIKWGAPAFMYEGILCGMAAFRQHVTLGFWRSGLVAREAGIKLESGGEAWGQFGRITSLDDLPSDRDLLQLVKAAVAGHDRGEQKPAKPRPAADRKLAVPAYFMAAIRKNRKALAAFQAFSYSHRKEYVEWVSEAKTDATREKRLATTVEWLAEGKGRNWKYERK